MLTGLYPKRPVAFTEPLRYFSIPIPSITWSNAITGSEIFNKSEINTGNLPCFVVQLISVYVFTNSLYHKRHITVYTFGYVPSFLGDFFSQPLFVRNKNGYSSICLPRNAAALCASFVSTFVGIFAVSPVSITTAPITSPEAMIG